MSAPRGQAVVETALGLLVFSSVLVFALHLAEACSLGVRLREAAASALWDTTAARMHHLPGDASPLHRAIAAAGPSATARFADLDGRSAAVRGVTVTQVFTAADSVVVECENDAALQFAPVAVLGRVYPAGGGVRCRASARLFPWHFTEHLADVGGGALFQAGQRPLSARLCAPGRGGTRCAAFGALLDDWGLAGADEVAAHPVTARCTDAYCASVARVVAANGGIDGHRSQQHAQVTTLGRAPPLPQVWLSFVGEEGAFTDTVPGGEPTSRRAWPTTPGAGSPVPEYDAAYAARAPCFLGRPCR